MHRSTSRILTTHTGSLPRPGDLVAMLNAKELGEPYDAKAFAARLSINPKEPDSERVTRAYRQLFSREPTREEAKLALEFLRKPARGESSRWEQYSQLLLASNEMMYVD